MKLWRKPFDQRDTPAKLTAQVLIDRNRCKGCGYCVEFCPRDALAMSDETNLKGYLIPKVVDRSRCVGCGLCSVICPDFAIYVISADDKKE